MLDPNSTSTVVAPTGDVVPQHGYLSWVGAGTALYVTAILTYGLVALLVTRLFRDLRDISARLSEVRSLADEVRDEISAIRRRQT